VLVHEVAGIAPLEGRADENGALHRGSEGDQFFCDGGYGIRVKGGAPSIYTSERVEMGRESYSVDTETAG
jgi:hypothetical protein